MKYGIARGFLVCFVTMAVCNTCIAAEKNGCTDMFQKSGVDPRGNDIRGVPNVNSSDECCYHCYQMPLCAAFTYNEDTKICWLKHTEGPKFQCSNCTAGFKNKTYDIKSDPVTHWGNWGSMEVCPEGRFVVGLQLKVQKDQGEKLDDTALNGIRLFCYDSNERNITSSVGSWGTWGSRQICPIGSVATGFQLRSEAEKERGYKYPDDDTAANDFGLQCGKTVIGYTGMGWGEWQPWKYCPRYYAVCGIQTQVEERQRLPKWDNSALNNVKLRCCRSEGQL